MNHEPQFCYYAALHRVVDGDTVDVIVDLGFRISARKRLRLAGIDAPELRGPERPEGLKTKEELCSKLSGREFIVRTSRDKKGKYGRWLAEIWLKAPEDKVSVNEWLVQMGLAKRWGA